MYQHPHSVWSTRVITWLKNLRHQSEILGGTHRLSLIRVNSVAGRRSSCLVLTRDRARLLIRLFFIKIKIITAELPKRLRQFKTFIFRSSPAFPTTGSQDCTQTSTNTPTEHLLSMAYSARSIVLLPIYCQECNTETDDVPNTVRCSYSIGMTDKSMVHNVENEHFLPPLP